MSLLQTVKEERGKYPTPLGLENAWKTINGVCLRHANEGWGLVDKPSGSNWTGYSVDVILNRYTGEAVDCLGDSEGQGVPAWNTLSAADTPSVTRWRQAIGDVPPEPGVPNPTHGDITARVNALEVELSRIKSLLRSV